jgi:hypothetical protein
MLKYDVMATFTCTLPDSLLKKLAEKAKALSVPKNKLIEMHFAYISNIWKRPNTLSRIRKLQPIKPLTGSGRRYGRLPEATLLVSLGAGPRVTPMAGGFRVQNSSTSSNE